MKRVVVFHPALAPYRVDYFNAIAERCVLCVVLMSRNLINQKFDQNKLLSQTKFAVEYLKGGFTVGGRHYKLMIAEPIRRIQPDLIIGYEFSILMVVLVVYRFMTRGRFVLYTATDDNVRQIESCCGLRKLMRNWVLRHIDGIITTNRDVESCICKLSRNSNIRVIDVPIIYDENRYLKNSKQIFQLAESWRTKMLKPGEYAVFAIGRLVAVKNLGWLIEQVADERWPRTARLFVVGSGPLEASLQSKVSKLGLGSYINFLGRKEGEELLTYFAACDVLVMPSISETFGAVVAESLHWGASVLVSDRVGAKTLVVETHGGDVFPFSDRDAFFEKLLLLLGQLGEWRINRKSKIKRTLSSYVDQFEF